MEKRLGCISIILDRQTAPVPQVNELISQFGDSIIGRLGLPYPSHGVNIITLITDSTVERLSSLTGKLGKLPGVQVKSLMSKSRVPGVTHDVDPSEQPRPN
jgi:putative iron-only hydrogenase system regulator